MPINEINQNDFKNISSDQIINETNLELINYDDKISKLKINLNENKINMNFKITTLEKELIDKDNIIKNINNDVDLLFLNNKFKLMTK